MFSKFKIKDSIKGATMIEYTLIASLISITLIGGWKAMGNSYKGMYDKIFNGVNNS